MTTSKELTIFALFACLLCLVTSQQIQFGGIPSTLLRAEQEDDTLSEEPNVINSNDDDNSDAAMARLPNITNVNAFLTLLKDESGNSIYPDDIFSEVESEDGKKTIIGGGRMAEPDECSPRDTTVKLGGFFPTVDPNELFFPQCTKLKRCGGCCSSRHLECVPAYTERVMLKVIRAKAPFPGSSHLVYKGFADIIVDQHLRCRVSCNLDAAKCGPKKRFLSQQCDCKCRRYRACSAPKFFSPNTCECECTNANKTCTSSNLEFNTRTCRCELPGQRGMNSFVNATDEERANYYRTRNMTNPDGDGTYEAGTYEESNMPVMDEVPTTTTTTTTTTPDPCSGTNCPYRYTRHVVGGVCVCRPNRRYQSRPRPRPRPRRQ